MATNFKIGQRVICVKSNSLGKFKNGQIFTIHGIKTAPCCGLLVIDIGIKSNHDLMKCVICNKTYQHENYYSASSFKPLEEEKGTITIEEILSEKILK